MKPWLYTIVRNRALNARRDARPEAPLSDDLDGVRQPDDIVLGAEELARVVAAVQALPEAQREALVRSALDGYSHEQIAAALGATPGAVRQLVYRARLAVRHGVGLAVPLPLVRVLSDFGAGEAATAALAGGTAVAGGTSALTEGTVVAVVGALALGSGVAIKRAGDRESEAAAAATRVDRGQADRNAASGSQPLLADGSGGPGGTAGSEGRSDDEREPEDRDDDRQTPGRAEDDPGEAEDELGGSGSGGGGSGDGDVDDSDTRGHADQVSSGTDDDAEPQTVDQDTGESSGPSHSESEHADSPDVSDEPDELDDSSGPTSSGPGPSADDDADEPTG